MSISSADLDGAAIKVGTPLNSKRLVVNIADYISLRLQNNVTALNWTLNFSIHNHALGRNDSVDMSPAGDHEGRAVKFAVNLAIDFD